MSRNSRSTRVGAAAAICLPWAMVVCCAQPGPARSPETTSREISIGARQVHYLESGIRVAGDPTVLLLHGARFSSRTWAELGTIEVLAAAGHHVIAVDLPGHGESTGRPPRRRADFLAALLDELEIDAVALVSPSMSGSFAIPFLLAHAERVSHFLPVAPVGIPENLEALRRIAVPTLALWGEDDEVIPVAIGEQLVAAMPQAELEVFPGAPHPAYLEATAEFHRVVLEFLAR